MKANERKKQILGAALEAFAEHGYERTSIAIICERAGIARPTLYRYFKDKRSVFRELLESHLTGVHKKLHGRQRARDGKKKLSPRETMQSLHCELLEEFVNNRNLYTILFKEAKARNAEAEDIVNGIIQGMMSEFVHEFKENPVSETLSEKDMEFMVMYMIGGLMQTVEHYLFDAENALSIQELADKITFIESRIKGI
jgi:AcrR family transcriptional regulator